MKNWLRLSCIAVAACLLFAPAHAMNIYQAPDGSIILETTSCQDEQRLWQVAEENTEHQTLAEPDEPVTPQDEPASGPMKFSEQDFNVAQSKLIAFVRDVNWKTGVHLTVRDANIFQRIKMVCTGILTYTKPFRAKLDAIDPNADTHLEELEDFAIKELEKGITMATFRHAAKLTAWGIHDAIIGDRPFLLLVIDEDTYNTVVELDPKVKELADNMYTFFAYRAAYMSHEYDKNTDELIRLARYGKGDAVNTWALFAQFAAHMYELDKQNDLTPDQEKEIHLWKLNALIQKVHHKVQVEKKAAKIAYKNPDNAALMEEINQETPKNPTIKQEAEAWLQKATQEQVKDLLRRYYGK